MDTAQTIDWEKLSVILLNWGGILTGALALLLQYRKAKVEERGGDREDNREDAKVYTDAAKTLVEQFEKRLVEQEKLSMLQADEIRKLKDERDELDMTVRMYTGGVRILVQQLEENGIKPRWTPPRDGFGLYD